MAAIVLVALIALIMLFAWAIGEDKFENGNKHKNNI